MITFGQTKNPRLVASYAVPPQTSFVAKPCSVFSHGKDGNPATRTTYAVAKSGTSTKPSLLCYDEKDSGAEISKPRKMTSELKSLQPVLSLESLESHILDESTQYSHDLLAIHQDGFLECFAPDLNRSLWEAKQLCGESRPIPDDSLIEHSGLADLKDVVNGLLQKREDIVAQLPNTSSTNANPSSVRVIYSVLKSNTGTRQLVLNTIRLRTSALSRFEPLQYLVHWELPEIHNQSKQDQNWTYFLDVAVGLLHVLQGHQLFTFDFTGLTPRASLRSVPSATFPLILPGSKILTGSASSYHLWDTKYHTLLDSHAADATSNQGKKRKRGEDSEKPTRIEFLNFFSASGHAIVLQDDSLVAVQIAPTGKSKTTRLIDALFQGNPTSKALHHDKESDTTASAWLDLQGRLEEFTKRKSSVEFDALFAQAVGINWEFLSIQDDEVEDLWVKGQLIWGVSPQNGHVGTWRFPDYKSEEKPWVCRDQALFLLSQIFETAPAAEDQASSALRIRFFPANAFHWLLITGQLSTDLIKQALSQNGSNSSDIAKTDLIVALAQFDPTFGLLYSIIQHHIGLDLEDLVQTIKYIVQSLDNSRLPAPQTLLTDGEEVSTNGQIENNVSDEFDAALQDVDQALSTLEHGLPIRGETLQLALLQINSFPSTQITTAFRTILTQHEIVFLVHILRIELSDGGWTSKYIDAGMISAEMGEPSDHAVSLIARLLSCAVDAIGTTGWLATTANNPTDSVDDLLVSLRAEISAALEGIHEATFLHGLLGEFLRYGAKLRTSRRWGESKNIKIGKENAVELPLGLQMDGDKVTLTRTQAGGRVIQRSKRDVGHQISVHAVPKYSFEKIRI
jgi:hypothetical protein